MEAIDTLDPTEALKQELDEETERNANASHQAAEIKKEPDYKIPRKYETYPQKEIKQELDYVITQNFDTVMSDEDEDTQTKRNYMTTGQAELYTPSKAKRIKQEEDDYDLLVHFDVNDHTSISVPADNTRTVSVTNSKQTSATITTKSVKQRTKKNTGTSPVYLSEFIFEESMKKSETEPLTEEEEIVFSNLVQRKLLTAKNNVIKCKSEGKGKKPILLERLYFPIGAEVINSGINVDTNWTSFK